MSEYGDNAILFQGGVILHQSIKPAVRFFGGNTSPFSYEALKAGLEGAQDGAAGKICGCGP